MLWRDRLGGLPRPAFAEPRQEQYAEDQERGAAAATGGTATRSQRRLPTSAPATRNASAETATKSQSMSTSVCRRYAGSTRASASSCPRRRRLPRSSASAATRNSASPTIPASARNCSGRLCGSTVKSR